MKLPYLALCAPFAACGTNITTKRGTAFHSNANAAYERFKDADTLYEAWNVDRATIERARLNGLAQAVTALGTAALVK